MVYSERYKIETKNTELKNNYGYGQANSCGKNRDYNTRVNYALFSQYETNNQIKSIKKQKYRVNTTFILLKILQIKKTDK